jgi:hypothetical protein
MRKFMSWIPPVPLLTVPMANVVLARPDAITLDVISAVGGMYADLSGQGSVVATPIPRRRVRTEGYWQANQDHVRRAPEQIRYRPPVRAQMARCRECQHAD